MIDATIARYSILASMAPAGDSKQFETTVFSSKKGDEVDKNSIDDASDTNRVNHFLELFLCVLSSFFRSRQSHRILQMCFFFFLKESECNSLFECLTYRLSPVASVLTCT